MDAKKVDQFIIANQSYFPPEKAAFLKEKLLHAEEDKFMLISSVKFKEPTTILIMSIFLGGLGVDRFMLGDTGLGILKLLTGGVCGILWLVDLFSVKKKAQEYNYNQLMLAL